MFIRELEKENENISKKNKELMDMLIQQREKLSSVVEKPVLKDNLAQHNHQYELKTQKVEKLGDMIKEFWVIRDHLEEAKQAEWDSVRLVTEKESETEGIDGMINKVREETVQEKVHTVKLQLTTVLENVIETWRKWASTAKAETQVYKAIQELLEMIAVIKSDHVTGTVN